MCSLQFVVGSLRFSRRLVVGGWEFAVGSLQFAVCGLRFVLDLVDYLSSMVPIATGPRLVVTGSERIRSDPTHVCISYVCKITKLQHGKLERMHCVQLKSSWIDTQNK